MNNTQLFMIFLKYRNLWQERYVNAGDRNVNKGK
jgi:hypothetical protein